MSNGDNDDDGDGDEDMAPVEKHDPANEVEAEEHWQTEGHIHWHPLINYCHDYDHCDK